MPQEQEDANIEADAVVEPVESGEVLTTEEADYEKMFDETVAARAAAKNGDSVEVVAPPVVEPAVEVVDTKKDAEAVVDAAPVDVKKEDAPKVDPVDAILDTLPEAAKAAFAALRESNAKLAHDNRSIAGRVSAYQRKYEEAAGKKPADVAKAATEEQTAEWKQIAEDHPELAKAIHAQFLATRPGVDANVEALVKFVEEERRARFMTEAGEAVDVVHPGWREKVKTKDFAEWQKSSPTHERLASSDDVSDAIALVDLWEAHLSKTTPKAPVADPKVAAEAAKLAAKRGAQAEGGKAAVTVTAVVNKDVDSKDEGQMYAEYFAAANARMKKRNQ